MAKKETNKGKSSKQEDVIGIYLTNEGLWVYKAQPEMAKYFKYEGGWEKTFSNVVSVFGKKSNVQLVVGGDLYKILVVDKPTVGEKEFKNALLLAIKDMVQIPILQLHIDYFEYPISTSDKVNVVAIDRNILSAIVTGAANASLNIKAISIEDIIISNLQEDSRAKLVVSHAKGSEALLSIVKDGTLIMQRRLRGYNALHQATEDDLSGVIVDKLSLEIQRSMDFFESQLRQPPVTSIECLIDGKGQKIAELLTNNFSQTINNISTESVASIFAVLAFKEWEKRELSK